MMYPPSDSGAGDRYRWLWSRLGMALAVAIALMVIAGLLTPAAPVSNYDLAQAKRFNQVESYPIQPLPTAPDYRPNGGWLGRLILPTEQEYATTAGDWAWFEVWHTPEGAPDLLGQTIKLTWQPNEANRAFVKAVTRDVAFSEQAHQFQEQGNILPDRLDGRKQVGPLQSLAGARPKDDMTVRLYEPYAQLVTEQGLPVLQTNLKPFQITGREYGLVTILEPDSRFTAPRPEQCPGPSPCPTEYFRVQHFNTAARDFTGTVETIRIPQQPKLNGGRFFSTIRDLQHSPAGSAGWYIYGSRDGEGLFTVQALKPRALFQLQPDEVILGQQAGLNYIDRQNWKHEPARKGTLQRVLVSPHHRNATSAIADWQEGDFALVIHLFGGIGGENKEPTPLGTVSGHFAYGLAEVVEEPIAQELQLYVLYQQVYSHNSGGIISGTHDWTSFVGDMQRGWLGIRPVSDVVVKLDAFTQPFQFGNTTISLFDELLKQAQFLSARYRIGDGTGLSAVTPATSCVQDSNQALYIAIEQVKRQLDQNPDIAEWLEQHPSPDELARIWQFGRVGQALADMLSPYGVVRPDWKNNADVLAGIGAASDLTHPEGLARGLLPGILSWRTMMPRWAHDEVSRVFLEHGAELWFLRTNMVGGDDPTVEPIPPTTLLGLIPGVGRAIQRFTEAVVVWPGLVRMAVGIIALGVYALGALPFGFKTGFLHRHRLHIHPLRAGLHMLRLLVVPVLVEETLFRVLLLPHPMEGVPGPWWLLWTGVSVGLYVAYHWLQGKFLQRRFRQTLGDRRFLILVGWLGLVLSVAYRLTGSLWLIALVHWIVLIGWTYGLGGGERLRSFRRLHQNQPFPQGKGTPETRRPEQGPGPHPTA